VFSILLFPLQAVHLSVSSLSVTQHTAQHAPSLPFVFFLQPLSFACPAQQPELGPLLVLSVFLSLKLPPISVSPALSLGSQPLTAL
jgi:hypothetical protein